MNNLIPTTEELDKMQEDSDLLNTAREDIPRLIKAVRILQKALENTIFNIPYWEREMSKLVNPTTSQEVEQSEINDAARELGIEVQS